MRARSHLPLTLKANINPLLLDFVRAGFGGGFSQLINFLVLPVITRLYTPREYATWALFLAAGTIIGSIANLRYELAIVLPKKDEEAGAVFWGGVAIALCIVLLGTGTLALFSILAKSLFVAPLYIIVFIGLFALSFAIYQDMRYWNIRLRRFALNSWAQILFVSMAAGVQVMWAVVYKATAMGLILGSLFGQISAFLLLIMSANHDDAFPHFSHDWRETVLLLKQYRNFFFYSTPYTLFGILRDRGVLFVLDYFAGSSVVGLYALAFRIMNFPVNLISNSLRPVLFQKAAKQGVRTVELHIYRILRFLVVVSVPFVVLYFFFANDIFRLLFGPAWVEAGDVGKFIILPIYTFLFVNWIDRLMDVLGEQRLTLILEVVFATGAIIGLVLGFVLNLGLGGALIIYASVLVAYNIAYLLFAYERASFLKIRLLKVVGYGAVSGGASLLLLLLGKILLF